MTLKLLISLVIVAVVYGEEAISEEEYMDSVINLLLNGESAEIVPSSEDTEGEQPVFSEGIWKCGSCDDVDKFAPMYVEENDLDTDVSDEFPIEVQVGLTLDNMRCITIGADASNPVRRVSGACVGARVTLAVSVTTARHFTVNVYD